MIESPRNVGKDFSLAEKQNVPFAIAQKRGTLSANSHRSDSLSESPVPLLLLLLALFGVAGCSGGGPLKVESEGGTVPSPSPQAVAEENEPPVTMSERERELHLESFDVVWSKIHENYWDPDMGGLDWEGLRNELRPRVENAKTASDAREAMSELVMALGKSHFAIIPNEVYSELSGEEVEDSEIEVSDAVSSESEAPGDANSSDLSVENGDSEPESKRKERNADGLGEPGFDLVLIGDQAVVRRVVPNSAATRAGVQMGWVLTEVDGRSLNRTIERFREMNREGGELELMLRLVVMSRLSGDPGDDVDLTFLDKSDQSRELTLTLGEPVGTPFSFGHMPQMVLDWTLERRGEIGYVRLSSFFEPVKVRAALSKFVEENLDAAGFVFDLRGNPGGIGFMANGLAGLFTDQSGQSLGTMYMRDGELKFGIYPQPSSFKGPLAILIDGGSASTSEIMAGGLRDLGRARLFGTRTAGAALPSTFERLPNGDGFQYAIANYISVGGEVLEGVGVAPDVEVVSSREKLLEGIDPEYEQASEWILQQT